MSISIGAFGKTQRGEDVSLITIKNEQGNYVEVLDYGCTIRSLVIKDYQGNPIDVVLGYDKIEDYEKGENYFGAIIGRHANRIGNAEFTLNDITYKLAKNDGENHLHGGNVGFDKVMWSYVIDEEKNAIKFNRLSPDGEEGYPGNLDVNVTYVFTEDNKLILSYQAVSDKDTVVNLTNHSYFNLNGGGSVLDHTLKIYADTYTENDEHCLTNGKMAFVDNTPFDFRAPIKIGRDIFEDIPQIKMLKGYDHNFILNDENTLKEAAVLYSDKTKIELITYTTKPGIQIYTGNFIKGKAGKNNVTYKPYDAVCLETQIFPNAMAHVQFPSPVLKAGERYINKTIYNFNVK